MHFPRLVLTFALVCSVLAFRCNLQAQSTNVLNLCTEAAFRSALGIGGNYFVQCSNLSTINLREPLVFTRDITMVATNEILLSGQNLTRLIIVRPGVRVTFQGFAFFSGRQTETNLNNGGIDDTAGGAIYNDGGTLTVLRSRFQGNSVVGITGAPAEDGTGEDGEPGGDAAGSAIYNNGGAVYLSNVVFEANSATGGVGGKGGNGRTSGFGSNGGNGGDGGSAAGAALYSNGGRVIVLSSTFTNNTAIGAVAGAAGTAGGLLGFPGQPGIAGDAVGGAIAGNNAEIQLHGSTFITNSVRGANGLAGPAGISREPGSPGFDGGDAAGAAIYSTGQLSVTNSTFFGNLAVSGNGGAGGAASSGGFGNDGGDGGDGGFASGGAIESVGSAVIVNCTFSDNVVTSGTGGAGGAATGLGESGDPGSAGPARGGAVFGSGSEVILANSILANSPSTIDGNVSDRGGNITTDLNPLIISVASFRETNPFLQPLASNGGPTPTMAIATNSPAIDQGLAQFCVQLDQRGSNRVGNCDIGAFEVIPPLAPIPSEVFGTNSLRIFDRTNAVVLRWPAGYTNLFLQVNTNLLTTNNVWTTITNGPNLTTSSNFNFLTITPDALRQRAFYRLLGNTTRTNLAVPFPSLPQ